MSKRSNTGDITTPDFKLYYRDIVIKTWHCHKNRYVDQWDRIEEPEINPCSYSDVANSDKCAKNVHLRKHLFNQWSWENWISTYRRLKFDPSHPA
jgi:hypothetical protein